MMARPSLEVEVKFALESLVDIKKRLVEAGATLTVPRTYETNARYDLPDGALMQSRRTLRLRQDSRARLTLKGDPPSHVISEAKVREELELEVSDGSTMALILARLGFQEQERYVKYRETFALDGVEVVVDELPFGDFVELEGQEACLREIAQRLGLEWSERITESYLSLVQRFCRHHDVQLSQFTFEAVRDTKAPLDDRSWLPGWSQREKGHAK